MKVYLVGAMALLVGLAGCGREPGHDAAASSAKASQGAAGTVGGTGYTADWARNPCKAFPVAEAAKASGLALTKAEVASLVEQDSIVNSTCSYTDGKEGNLRVAFHINTDGEQTIASQIAQMAERPDITGPMHPLTVATGKAFWLPTLHSVVYYPDDQRSVTVIAPSFTPIGSSGPESQQQAEALAIALAAAR